MLRTVLGLVFGFLTPYDVGRRCLPVCRLWSSARPIWPVLHVNRFPATSISFCCELTRVEQLLVTAYVTPSLLERCTQLRHLQCKTFLLMPSTLERLELTDCTLGQQDWQMLGSMTNLRELLLT